MNACTTANPAFQDAQTLRAQGRTEESLAKFAQARQLDPNNAQIRMAYETYREQAITQFLNDANDALLKSNFAQATLIYQRILATDPGNRRALDGLRRVQRAPVDGQLLHAAENALAAKDDEGARQQLRMILAEEPDHARARELLGLIETRTQSPTNSPELAEAYRRTISIDFSEASIKQVFEVLSKTSGLNFVFDKDVHLDQKVTVYLRKTSIKDAINTVLLTGQLAQRVLDKSTVLIYPDTTAKQKDYQPLTVRSFFLANAEAEDVAASLKTLLKTRDIVVDKKQNMVLMRDTPEAISLAERIVALHDLPEPEVMLEVEVLEVNRDRLTNLGITFPDQLSLVPLPAGTALTLADVLHARQATTGATISPLVINAKGTGNDANLLANPRIRARNKETAKILIGDKVPNITSTSTTTGFVAENIQYLDVGLKLEVTPTISINDEIAIKISLEVSTIANQVTTTSGSLAYTIGTRSASTVLRLRDGENQILAGLIDDERTRTSNHIPGLGNIPVLGRLFGTDQNEKKNDEIVLSITPRLIRNKPRMQLQTMEFQSGTESSLRDMSIHSNNSSDDDHPSAPGNGSPKVNAAPDTNPNQTDGLQWRGPLQVKTGDTFRVDLDMKPTQPLASLPMVIGYDPKQVEVLDVKEGPFLSQGGVATLFTQRVDRSVGQIYVTDARNSDLKAATGATATATALSLTFKALSASASAQIRVISAAGATPDGTAVNLQLPAPQSVLISP
ncbi:general secretion pathway protein GspD (plasmid) [Burkholderia sp. PAMC 26561]|nr:general secretion pathway protein GspD [Burkholderia sp. PAMC 26561]